MHERRLIAWTMCVDCTESQSVFLPSMVLNHLYISGCLKSLVDVCAGSNFTIRFPWQI